MHFTNTVIEFTNDEYIYPHIPATVNLLVAFKVVVIDLFA